MDGAVRKQALSSCSPPSAAAGLKRRSSSFNHPRLEHIMEKGKGQLLARTGSALPPCRTLLAVVHKWAALPLPCGLRTETFTSFSVKANCN